MESVGIRELRKAIKMAEILGYTQREKRFNRASLYYWGRQYEDLQPWTAANTKLRDKKPSVQVGLTRKAVNKVNAHLFGVDHLPSWKVERGSEDLDATIAETVRRSGLRRRYSELGRLGCLHGTVAVGFHVFEDRLDVEIIAAGTSEPTFGRDDRRRAMELGVDFDDLLELREFWRDTEEDEFGDEHEYWHRRDWTTTETIEYAPIPGPINDPDDLEWVRDEDLTVEHNLGFVPAEWITPIEVAHDIDGAPIVDEPEFRLEDEVNYTLSQTGRGIRYNQEPTLVFLGVDADSDSAIRRGANNTLKVQTDPAREGGQNADAKLMEMSGTGSAQAMEYVSQLRGLFNEIVQIVDHDPKQFAGALSGVALERLLYPMVMLVQNLRTDYEEKLGRLISKMLEATGAIPDYRSIEVIASWPPVVEPTAQDLRDYAMAVVELYEMSIIDRKKVVEVLAPFLSVDDVDSFIAQVEVSLAEEGTTQTGGATEEIPPIPGVDT